ncbi:MAG: undecaprenyl-diphosphate phosphatase [Oscillospiraceae bacterium]|jgi:undecaprenyl-diphosphatase
MDILKSILYGLLEGITEWLPISSTGHMIILNEFVRFDQPDSFMSVFLVVIQLGAILAVVIRFWKKLWPFGKNSGGKVIAKKDRFSLWGKIIVACLPAAVVGVLFDRQIEDLFYNAVSVAIALIVFGVAFIVVERANKNRKPRISSMDDIDYKTAFLIGLFQVLAAVFPGTSRSGATIIGALILGVSRTAAAEFTFCLAVPVMIGASCLKIVQYGGGFTGSQIGIIAAGMITAFFVSALVIRFLMGYVKKHDFQIFGWYRICLGILVLALHFAGVLEV